MEFCVLIPEHRPGQKAMEDPGCPFSGTPLSNLASGIQRKGEPVQLALAWLQELPEGLAVQRSTAYGAPLRIFVLGFSPLAFPM